MSMKSLEKIDAANRAAVLREYQEAVDDKNTELALRILRANPDVFEMKDWEGTTVRPKRKDK